MYVKSEFKGGEESKDIFDLNLYYTINEADKSVVGVSLVLVEGEVSRAWKVAV